MNQLITQAVKYIENGLSVIPVGIDKRPLISWASYQSTFIDLQLFNSQIKKNNKESAIGIVCGKVSGNLMVLDIDNKTDEAYSVLNDLLSIAEIYEIVENYKIPIIRTQNNGFHLLFRVRTEVDGSTKLAMAYDKEGKKQTLIETRGEGSYVLAFPSKGYALFNDINPKNIPTISEEEMNIILSHSRSFNSDFKINEPFVANQKNNDWNIRPGDAFNRSNEALDVIKSILVEKGWVHISNERWKRPNKKKGVSATLNYRNSKLFYIFTSSTEFEINKAYTPFSVYTILKHNGDYKSSTSELYSKGYGDASMILDTNNDGDDNENSLIINEEVEMLSTQIFENLPITLKEIVGAFDSELEKNLILLSSLTVMGHAFSNVFGTYDKYKVHPNIFVFIAMPASSGKGIMNWALKLGEAFDEFYSKEYADKKNIYDLEKDEKNKSKENSIEPTKVYFSIPTNISTAGFIDQLRNNQNRGLLFDTEADVLSRNKNQKWGDIGSELRQAFHHEKMSMARKTDKERVEIIDPRISVLLSGTIKQIVRFIPDEEDGLFSRFLFFFRNEYSKFRSPFSKSSKGDLILFFQNLSQRLFNVSKLITNSTEFFLSNSQEEKFNIFFSNLEESILQNEDKSIFPSARRSGIITYRIAMILTVLRTYENQQNMKRIECIDQDLETALAISSSLLLHSKKVLSELYKNNNHSNRGGVLSPLYKILPSEFSRQKAIELGLTIQLGEKAVEAHITKLIKYNKIERTGRGNYVKIL